MCTGAAQMSTPSLRLVSNPKLIRFDAVRSSTLSLGRILTCIGTARQMVNGLCCVDVCGPVPQVGLRVSGGVAGIYLPVSPQALTTALSGPTISPPHTTPYLPSSPYQATLYDTDTNDTHLLSASVTTSDL